MEADRSDPWSEYASRVRQLATQEAAAHREEYQQLLLELAAAVEGGHHLEARTIYYCLPLPLYQAVGVPPPRAT